MKATKKALKLGYTKPLSEMYETAGIPFDFSKAHIKSLGEFVKKSVELALGFLGLHDFRIVNNCIVFVRNK
ncbi:MAG: hypothetical protein R2728_13465 [Chitinophagales bacterium]